MNKYLKDFFFQILLKNLHSTVSGFQTLLRNCKLTVKDFQSLYGNNSQFFSDSDREDASNSQGLLESARELSDIKQAFPESAQDPASNSQRFADSVQEPPGNIDGFLDSALELVANSQGLSVSDQEPASNNLGHRDSAQEPLANSQEIPVSDEELSESEELEKESDSKLRGIKFDTCVHTGDLSLEINKSLSVAPGEGKRPVNILSDEKFEELSFPGLFPAGQFGRTHPRPVPLSSKNISSGEFNREVENLHLILSTFLLDNWYHKLRKTFSKFYRRHYELVSKFSVGLKTLLHQGLSEPEFYGDLVYKFKKIVGRADFSDQFRKIIVR